MKARNDARAFASDGGEGLAPRSLFPDNFLDPGHRRHRLRLPPCRQVEIPETSGVQFLREFLSADACAQIRVHIDRRTLVPPAHLYQIACTRCSPSMRNAPASAAQAELLAVLRDGAARELCPEGALNLSP